MWLYIFSLCLTHDYHASSSSSSSYIITFLLLSIFLFIQILRIFFFFKYIFLNSGIWIIFQRWWKKKKGGRTEIAHLQNESIMRVSVSMPDWFPAVPVNLMEMLETRLSFVNYYSKLCLAFSSLSFNYQSTSTRSIFSFFVHKSIISILFLFQNFIIELFNSFNLLFSTFYSKILLSI